MPYNDKPIMECELNTMKPDNYNKEPPSETEVKERLGDE